MLSPRGVLWKSYIQHRFKMLRKGMDIYATLKYARLPLNKYIESNRKSDEANKITDNQPSMVYLGVAEFGSNPPIGEDVLGYKDR